MSRHNFTGKHTYRSLLIGALLLGGNSLAGLSVFAASPTPGTVIENQATGSYIDESDNSTQTLVSDKVTVTVGEVAGITVTSANTPSATTGAVVDFDFTITNVGNDPTQFFIPDAPSAITGGTAGTLKIVAYDPDGSGPAAAVDLTGNNVTVPSGGGNTGTLLGAIASANNGSIPAGATIVVRVPVTVTATGGQTVSVTLGNTSGQPSNSNTPYILGANGTGSKDLYTVDNADNISGESAGVPINGDATNHRQEASAAQTITVTPLDYGDAPASYGTLLANDGARHTISGLYLGAGVTADTDGQPNATATGDANDDGVTFSPTLGANYSTVVQAGISNQVKVVSSGSGFVNAWIDYNQNGVFDSGEQILTNQAVVAGTNTLTFTPPNTATHGSTFARFRLSPTSIASPSPVGLISGGEVEDYQVSVAAPVPNGAACTTTGLLNGSFETPVIGLNTFSLIPKSSVPGWNTTASDQLIELWGSGFSGGGAPVPSYAGNQFAEMNANQKASLYQDIATVPGTTLTFQFAHRARATNTPVVDSAAVSIGVPGGTLVQQNIYKTDSTDWVVYQSSYVVPAGQYITRFQFDSLTTGLGDPLGNPAVGNFLDGVQFSVSSCVTPISPPTIDLDGNNSTATGNNYQNTFLVGGAAVAAADTDVMITDDKTNITRAIFQLTTTPDGANESLTIDPTAGGTVTGVTVDLPYDSTGASTIGRLTLKGSATLADYQKIIATLKYTNTKASPTMSDRIINVQVIDSDKAISNTATSTIKMVVGKSISGTLYRDNDRSGTNNSEPGIGNITVILYKDNDNNRELSPSEIIQQVTTLADGTYQFTNVAPGTYKIKVDIADTDVPLGYTLGTTDSLPVTVNTTNITGQDFGFYPALTCEWEAQIYSGHYPIPGANYAKDTQSVGLFGTGGLPTLRGTAKFGAGSSTFTFDDQSIGQTAHPLKTIINGTFVSSGYVPINGDYISTQTNFGQPSWVIVFKRQAIAKGRVTLGQVGAYIDDAMEVYINGVRVGNPVLAYTTSLPANKVSTVSVNAGDIVEIRLSNYDNVGGFKVSTEFVSDFGDAPNSYGEVAQAPSCSNPHLGATSTGEYNQSYSANADGDAGDDGVTLPSTLTPGTTATIIVNASTAGFLNSWIDFNKNGVFDSGEQLSLTNVTKGTAATVNNVPLNAGNNTLTFTVPSNATVGSSFARFRFTASTVATPSPTGSGDAGEVEDYPIVIATPSNVLLVKRITAINGDRTKNPNDNTPLNIFVDDTTSTHQADDNSPNWKPNYLLGAIDAGKIKPGDDIEYTVYFLNAGSITANVVRVCDRISANQNFKVGAYGTSKDVQLQLGTSTVLDLTSANDTADRTQLISAGGTVPTNCYLKATNDNGTLVIDVTGNTGVPNLTTMPGSTGQGSPNDSYGFFRFVTKVKP